VRSCSRSMRAEHRTTRSKKGLPDSQIQNLEKDIKEGRGALGRAAADGGYPDPGQPRPDQKLYERLLATCKRWNVNKGINAETVTIMETHRCQTRPAGPDQEHLSGRRGGLMIGFLVLMLVERLDDRMSSFTELQSSRGKYHRPDPKDGPPAAGANWALIQPDDTRHAFLEAYRNLPLLPPLQHRERRAPARPAGDQLHSQRRQIDDDRHLAITWPTPAPAFSWGFRPAQGHVCTPVQNPSSRVHRGALGPVE